MNFKLNKLGGMILFVFVFTFVVISDLWYYVTLEMLTNR